MQMQMRPSTRCTMAAYGSGATPSNKPPIFDGKHTTHKNGDEWGMVYDIAIATFGTCFAAESLKLIGAVLRGSVQCPPSLG